MNTTIKKIISLTLVLIICCTMFCACGISESKAVGTWTYTYEFEGSEFSVTLVLADNGKYSMEIYKDGSFFKLKEGDWGIDGGNVMCYTQTGATEYDYKDGALVNGAQNLVKE